MNLLFGSWLISWKVLGTVGDEVEAMRCWQVSPPLRVRESARPPAKYHSVSRRWEYSFTQNSLLATLAAATCVQIIGSSLTSSKWTKAWPLLARLHSLISPYASHSAFRSRRMWSSWPSSSRWPELVENWENCKWGLGSRNRSFMLGSGHSRKTGWHRALSAVILSPEDVLTHWRMRSLKSLNIFWCPRSVQRISASQSFIYCVLAGLSTEASLYSTLA